MVKSVYRHHYVLLTLLVGTFVSKFADVSAQSVTPSLNSEDDSVVVVSALRPVSKVKFISEKTNTVFKGDLQTWLSKRPAYTLTGNLAIPDQRLKMVVLGGGLEAGVRDGGLYRFSQMSAFPNLVARQLNIENFVTPLFSLDQENGTGFLIAYNDGTNLPRWQVVANKTARIKRGAIPSFERSTNQTVHNLAVPQGDLTLANTRICEGDCGIYPNGKPWSTGQIYAQRILPDNKRMSLLDYMSEQSFNFYMIEDGFDDLIDAVKSNSNLTSYGYDKVNLAPTSALNALVKRLSQKTGNTKGVLFTLPLVTTLPFLNWYSSDLLKENYSGSSIKYTRNGKTYQVDKSSRFYLLPTATVDSLFRTKSNQTSRTITLSDQDIMDDQEIIMTTDLISTYNGFVRQWANENKFALVDLELIYKRIQEGDYSSADGAKVTGGPKGNFFSSDGTYPSAVGHAVLANEIINSINKTYQANVPFINLTEYRLVVE